MLDFDKLIVKDYKCFKEETFIQNIKPINIIIGKNNIGKSSLLDILEIINNKDLLHLNSKTNIVINKTITESDISTICYKGHSGGIFKKEYRQGYSRLDNYEIGKKFIGQKIGFYLNSKRENSSYDQTCNFYTSYYNNQSFFNPDFDKEEESFYAQLSAKIKYTTKNTKRIYAERNIVAEEENSSMNIDGYGNGITRVINNYLNKSNYDESLIKEKLLNKLNEIMGEDANFTEIITQQVEYEKDNFKWEVFLREEEKGRIALSQSGSGLKTILMVLVYTILLPNIEKDKGSKTDKPLQDYIFLFEELENNLHPSLERRLLKYIEELANEGTTIFLTTHSNTVLDSFQNNDNVQIYHIIKENKKVDIKILDNILGKKSCLNDIGIKASDILQSNGVIWVEGPSDRIYINKWIELWSNGEYKEGLNYTCVFYGGRLLANITFEDDSIKKLVNLMLVNRNSIVLIDSDKRKKYSKINATKKRIEEELNKNNQFCWITKGREIENYIPLEIIKTLNNDSTLNKFDMYEDIAIVLNRIKKDEGKRFERNKVGYAQKFIESMTLENMSKSLDLDTNMRKVKKQINIWNKK